MKPKIFIKIISIVSIIAFIMVYKATSSSAATVYIPSELSNSEIPRLRIGGRVTAEEIKYTTEPNLKLQFSISDPIKLDKQNEKKEGNKISVPVIYEGLKPDMFAPGRDVIIEGEYKNGRIYAATLMTQCPSKYVPPTEAAK